MAVNTGAIPFAVALIVAGVGIWVFRVQLTELSDQTYGRNRTPEAQRRFARIAVVPLVLCVGMAIFFLLAPIW